MKNLCTFLSIILLLLLGISFCFAESQKDLIKQNQKNFFIENKGQWPEEVKFLAKINGMNAWVTKSGITYDFYKIEARNPLTPFEKGGTSLGVSFPPFSKGVRRFSSRVMGFPQNSTAISGHVVKMSMINQSESTYNQFIGVDKLEEYHNYFIGNDSTKWASFVPLFSEVLVKNPDSGINTRYYFDNGMIRYDYIIEPGKNPLELALICDMGYDDRWTPPSRWSPSDFGKYINENGELVLNTSLGEIIQGKIFAYQEINGSD